MSSALIIHTDGGSRGNPGPGAAAYVVAHEGKIIASSGRFLGYTTNNMAEYQGLIDALVWAARYMETNTVSHELVCNLDSALVVNQVQGKYKIKEPRLRALAEQVWSLMATHHLKVNFVAIPRAQNAAADALVNQALDVART